MLSIHEQIATVTLTATTMTTQLAAQLRDVAEQLQYVEEVSIVIIQATSPHFLPYVEDDGDVGHYAFYNQVTMMLEAWARLPQVIMAVIDGACAQIGLSIACLADIRIGSKATTIAHTGLALGGVAKRFSQLVGKGVAMHVFVGGHVMDAQEAQLRGFLRVEASPQAAVEQLAKQLSAQSKIAMQYTKESILRGSDLTFQQALLHEMDLYMLVQTSHDRLEGVEAYLQKRAPQFKGE